MSKEKKLAVIFCPPLSDHPKKPDDISKAKLVNCPLCKNKMWYSIKKKKAKVIAKSIGMDIWFGCYRCFMLEVIKDKDVWKKSDCVRVDI